MRSIFKKKNQNSFSTGGYKKYRKPALFGSGKTLKEIAERQQSAPKKDILKPFLSNFKLFITIVGAIFFVWLLFFSNYFAIKDVFVEGNNLTMAEEISSYAPKGHNIFFLNIKSTKTRMLQEHAELKDVLIYKGLPNAIKFVVLEEDPKIIWQTGSDRFLVSSQGKIAGKVTEGQFSDLPTVFDKKNIPVSPGEHLISPNFLAFVKNINDNFFDKTGIKLTNFEIDETTFDVNARTEAGFYVKFSSIRSSNKQLEDLKMVLAAHRQDIREYVDLRIDGWGYYK